MRLVSDADLLAKADSDASAFEALFARHAGALRRYIARRVEPSVVDDLVSETFARAFHHRARYRQEYPDARPWLFGIAANLIRHHLRSERARLSAYLRIERELAAANPGLPGATAVTQPVPTELAAALQRLKQPDREALLLMVWGELSYEEIARALEIPVGTVRSRINRARRRLRELLCAPAADRRPRPCERWLTAAAA